MFDETSASTAILLKKEFLKKQVKLYPSFCRINPQKLVESSLPVLFVQKLRRVLGNVVGIFRFIILLRNLLLVPIVHIHAFREVIWSDMKEIILRMVSNLEGFLKTKIINDKMLILFRKKYNNVESTTKLVSAHYLESSIL